MRRLAAIVLLILAGACTSPPPAPPPAASPPKVDPGIAACRQVADRAAKGQTPTDAQRAATWRALQASTYDDLREVGSRLQRAWTAGDLAAQIDANTGARMACAAHGVAVP